jgi:hypothetical protein
VDQHFEIIHWDVNKLDYVSSLKYHQQSNLILSLVKHIQILQLASQVASLKQRNWGKNMEALPCHRLVLYEVKWNESFDMVGHGWIFAVDFCSSN